MELDPDEGVRVMELDADDSAVGRGMGGRGREMWVG